MIAAVQSVPLSHPVKVRLGGMRDCKDILTVYQTTRWLRHRYTNVEEVKAEHRAIGLSSWGWLVAELDGHVVGEILFKVEKNPITGTVGVISSMDVDIRHQRRKIGTQLVTAAEEIMKHKRASRITAISPPEAYNFWMKIKYFARGSLINASLPPRQIPPRSTAKVITHILKEPGQIHKDWIFSHIAPPGDFTSLLSEVVDRGQDGTVAAYYSGKTLVGIGIAVRGDDRTARFLSDVTVEGLDYSDVVISRTAKFASTWRAASVWTRVPKDHVNRFMSLADWKIEVAREIPVTRLL